MIAPLPNAFGVRFADLARWNPASFFAVRWHWSDEVIAPLSKALIRKTVPFARKEAETPPMATLHFDGSLVPRDLRGKKSPKGKLFRAQSGDVVYSKIDVRNGAIGIVPDVMPEIAVTSEFPVYRVHPEVALPGYVHLLFRTTAFRQQINSMISGASGRKRVEPSALEDLQVPLPPLATQRAILAQWHKARKAIAAAEAKAKEIDGEIERQFLASLGLQPPKRATAPKFFGATWSDFPRWSVSYNQAATAGMDITRGRFPVVDLGSILAVVQYGTSEKANTRGEGVPVLRINNIKHGKLDLKDLKHIPMSDKVLAGLKLQPGDILIIRTSGSRGLVGTCAVFHESEPYVYASYLIRLRTQADRADPDYVAHLINSVVGQQQVNAVSRQIMQNNINSKEIAGLQIPLPPLDIQRQIMRKVATEQQRIEQERVRAKTVSERIEEEMEAYLLGRKKVPTS